MRELRVRAAAAAAAPGGAGLSKSSLPHACPRPVRRAVPAGTSPSAPLRGAMACACMCCRPGQCPPPRSSATPDTRCKTATRHISPPRPLCVVIAWCHWCPRRLPCQAPLGGAGSTRPRQRARPSAPGRRRTPSAAQCTSGGTSSCCDRPTLQPVTPPALLAARRCFPVGPVAPHAPAQGPARCVAPGTARLRQSQRWRCNRARARACVTLAGARKAGRGAPKRWPRELDRAASAAPLVDARRREAHCCAAPAVSPAFPGCGAGPSRHAW